MKTLMDRIEAQRNETVTALYETLRTNSTARANLIEALQALDAAETYSNESCERRSHLHSVLVDQSIGLSGGNNSFREMGWEFRNGTWQGPRAELVAAA